MLSPTEARQARDLISLELPGESVRLEAFEAWEMVFTGSTLAEQSVLAGRRAGWTGKAPAVGRVIQDGSEFAARSATQCKKKARVQLRIAGEQLLQCNWHISKWPGRSGED